ncbi:hypothetical protein HDV03_001082 [Kappamyces sp. JEL0829]|nr:hypothetical protein HDV03_001082 [Kappamyces sp. JEL0829]
MERVAEEQFFAQHRPLLMGGEMQSIHVTGYPSSLPGKALAAPALESWESIELVASASSLLPRAMTQKDHIAEPAPTQRSISLVDALLAPHPIHLVVGSAKRSTLYLINILKRRRKKMNKHKWKKYRREVRNSTRYNPERTRKKKKMKRRALVL